MKTDSVDFIEQGASIGEIYSQYNLGLIYRIGEEVTQDLSKAAYWFERAASRGLASAQIELSIMYCKGNGLEVDLAESFKWALLGEMNGDSRGSAVRTYCTENFDTDSLQDGHRRAQSFLNK